MLQVKVNGELLAFEAEPTIEDILDRVNAPRTAVAVEVNQVVVPGRSHAERRLKDGDEVEVVTFVGGG